MGMALERIPGTPIVGMVDLFEYVGAPAPAVRPVIQSSAGLSCRCPACGGSIRLVGRRRGGTGGGDGGGLSGGGGGMPDLMTHFGAAEDERA
jgi:hypothetical protein